jgi:hypothetical protein
MRSTQASAPSTCDRNLELVAEGPEAEEADAVLPLQQQLTTLLRREVALPRVADVGSHVRKGLGTQEIRNDALAVVQHPERRHPALTDPRDRDPPCSGVQRILHQLGEGFPGISLRAREPADELERIGGARSSGPHLALPARTHGLRA